MRRRLTRATKDQYLLGMALMATIRSEDPWRKVACIVADKHYNVLSTGYNGLLPKVELPDEVWQDREARLVHVIHSEVNALSMIKKGEASVMACTLAPCLPCSKEIAVHGINRFLYLFPYQRDDSGINFLSRHGVQVIKYDPSSIWAMAQEIINSQFELEAASASIKKHSEHRPDAQNPLVVH